MFKKSITAAIAISCFNLHASHDYDQQKFQELKYSIDPAKIALEKHHARKLHEKEDEEKKAQLSSTNKYLYTAVGVVVIAGLYVLNAHSNKK